MINSKIYQQVFNEVFAVIPHHETAKRLANLCDNWDYEKNPFFIDQAVLLCEEKGLLPTKTIFKCVVEVAGKRLSGGISGTSENIQKDNRKYHALSFMLQARYIDRKLTIADSIAKSELIIQKIYPDIEPFGETCLRKAYKTAA